MPVNNINLSPYSVEQADIERRRRLAEALTQQSMQPQQTEMVGGWAIPQSPLQGLSRMAQALAGNMGSKKADERTRALAERIRGERNDTISRAMTAMQGRPGGDAQAGDPRAAYGILAGSHDPDMQKFGLQQMLKGNEGYTLTPGAVRMGADNKPVARADFAPHLPELLKYQELLQTIAPDDPFRKQITGRIEMLTTRAPEKKDDLTAALEAAGVDTKSPEAQALFKARATKIATHAPPVQLSQSISTEKKYGEQFAGKIAQADSNLLDAATKAPELADRANRIKQILASGNVITGFGADFRLKFGKAAALAGLNGADDAAANTETLAASLAQNTMDAIKASGMGGGTGFSNADRDFLEKAVGGKINLEPQAIGRLADLAHRAASLMAKRWNKRVKEIPATAIEGTGIKTDPVQVAPLFGTSRSTDKAPQGVNPSAWAVMTPQESALSPAELEELIQLRKTVGNRRRQ